ncbi:ATP-binding protein [Dactylosporangium sucinum]|uniref:histidine kinase n=1 Tax=Dactylosporangium sucinum TaxID=1424081 RepID=A0A917TAQ1_9ACTN|nr:ATP-binding protein [Dactylosporangium sucinum]GGM16569.1 sensor histidine kinase [Dactylosporangium sucinum]
MTVRGKLRVYLGAAPGAGTTVRMFDEARRRAGRGTDVVVGPSGGLDVDALLARAPQLAVVDGLARHWPGVERLLDAGIDVLSTLDMQDVDAVPDAVIRRAGQVELVDDGVAGPELRERALLWLADRVDKQLDAYRGPAWEVREKVVVALTGGPEGDALVRRAARIALRGRGADLLAVHVVRGDGLAEPDPAHLSRQRLLVEQLGGSFHQVVGDDVPAALLDFARGVNATQLVLGASRRGRLAQLVSRGVGATTIAGSGPIDVHLVTHEQARRGRARPARGGLTARRRLLGLALALAGLPALTVGLLSAGLSLPTDILAFLILAVGVALVGGLVPALVAAVAGFLLLNYFFTPPMHRFTVAERENLFALSAFVLVAVAVATVVDLAARRTREAAAASAEARTLSTLAGSVLHGDRPLPALLERVRESFALSGAALLLDGRVVVSAGLLDGPPTPVAADGSLVLSLYGHPLRPEDRRMVEAFAAHAAIALRQERLAAQAAEASALAEADKLRTALLSAVSHDLRTPLAAAKAAVGSLRSPDVSFSRADREELLATAEESLDKLTRLVTNLLDMSRLQAGALALSLQPVDVQDAVTLAGADLPGIARLRVPDDLPPVSADPALLDRILANLLENALHHTPPGAEVTTTAFATGETVEIHVIDHGPGVPAADRDRIFQPFQRLGDRDNTAGVGLGLALSRGLAEAMGGTLTPHDTPGGGLTMALTLRRAADSTMP